jgi:excinuclease UvrABC nuclease subunit
MIKIADASEFKGNDVPVNPGVYIYKDEKRRNSVCW